MVELYVFGVSVGVSKSGVNTLMLKEVLGSRYLLIEIGISEARAIALPIENIISPRPLTHDLISNLARAFDITIERVVINKIQDRVFFSELVCFSGMREVKIDARTSDAVAVAVRSGCPILIDEELLQQYQSQSEKVQVIKNTKDIKSLPEGELREMLRKAVEVEDYEQAIVLKDELKRRDSDNTKEL